MSKLEEVAKLLSSGKVSLMDLVDKGLDPKIITEIEECAERLKFLELKENSTTKLKDFILFTKPDYDMGFHHAVICDEIDHFLYSGQKEHDILVLQAPPRTGKSEIVSRRLPPYVMGKDPDKKVVFTTYAAELAKKINRDTQRIIDNPTYRLLFPNTRLNGSNVRSDARGSYIRTTDQYEIVGYEGSLKTVGCGGPLTGFGFDVGIIDDVVKDMKAALSPTQSETVWDWYTSVFLTRRAPNAKIIIMMTRWGENDLIGRVLADAKKNNSTKVKVLSFPMTYEEDAEHENLLDERMEDGEPLWPSWFDKEYCDLTKENVGSKVWASLYQQRPSPAGGAIFHRDWFNWYDELPEFDYTLLSLDAAFKDAQTSDYVVFGVWGVKGKRKYLIDMVRERLSFTNTCANLYILLAKYPDLTELLIEEKANGAAIINTLDEDPRIHIPIIPYNPTESKEARAFSVSPQVEAGQIYLPNTDYEGNHSKSWVFDYLDEMAAFPNAKNDDVVDMTTQLLIRVSKSTMGWMEAIMARGDVQETHIDARIKGLADKMGWNVHNPNNTKSGLDF